MSKKKKRQQYELVDVIPPTCRCGSTDREPYHQIRTLDIQGVTPNGFHYTRIVFKRTRCKSCGQARVDRHFEHPQQIKSVLRTAAE